MRSLYQVLGVRRTATTAEIKSAYRARSKRLHPDHGGDPAKFRELVTAYKTLSDPALRAAYDAPKPKAPRAPQPRPHNPHPGMPPPTPTQRDAMIQQMRDAGVNLIFDTLGDVAPVGEHGDMARQAVGNVIETILGRIL